MAKGSSLSKWGSSADRLLALFGAAGVGVSFMEPRLFWFGAVICAIVAVSAIRLHWTDFKKVFRDWKRLRNYNKPPKLKVLRVLFGVLGLILFCAAAPIILFLNRAPEPILNYGILTNSWYEWALSFLLANPEPKVEFGNSGAVLKFAGPAESPILKFWDAIALTIETKNNRVLVSTVIKNSTGQTVATLTRNEWKSAVPPHVWDRNYSNNALEIKAPTGEIILQVKLLPDRIQMQGIWFGTDNSFVAMSAAPNGKGGLLTIRPPHGNGDVVPPIIKPMFKYPSDLHLGELAD